MPGPAPKASAERRRRNRKAGASVLQFPTPEELVDLTHVPPAFRELPPPSTWGDEGDGWHATTVEWWRDVVRSPMARDGWSLVDWHGLVRVARLVDAVAWSHDLDSIVKALTEVRLQGALYGLTPIDRARLHWELEKGERAHEATERRRVAKSAGSTRRDPRAEPAPTPPRRTRTASATPSRGRSRARTAG